MINENDRTFVITKENGEKVTCDILFTYHSEQFHSDYVVFVQKGSTEAQASKYKESGDGKQGQLEAITSDAEWDMLEKLLKQYNEEQ